jgi:hypothetical protein
MQKNDNWRKRPTLIVSTEPSLTADAQPNGSNW